MRVKFLGKTIELDDIESIEGIFPPTKKKFDDSQCSSDDERDWQYNFSVNIWSDDKYYRMKFTQYDTKGNSLTDLQRVRQELIDMWETHRQIIPEIK
jgi:hypothetical protein